MKKKPQKKVRTSVAFTPTLHAALKEMARKRSMSMSDYIEALASKSVGRN